MRVDQRQENIRALEPLDAPWLEALHAHCFDAPQQWSAPLFASLLGQAGVKGFALVQENEPAGFILGRRVVEEAEILTLAVLPTARRKGFAACLISVFLKAQKKDGAENVFIEVAVNNHPAILLYKKTQFQPVSIRPNYYAQESVTGKTWVDGIVMQLRLTDDNKAL